MFKHIPYPYPNFQWALTEAELEMISVGQPSAWPMWMEWFPFNLLRMTVIIFSNAFFRLIHPFQKNSSEWFPWIMNQVLLDLSPKETPPSHCRNSHKCHYHCSCNFLLHYHCTWTQQGYEAPLFLAEEGKFHQLLCFVVCNCKEKW